MLYQIILPSAVFGIETDGERVVDAAPIGAWMIGKSFMDVADWVAKKHGTARKVKGSERSR